MLLYRLLSAPFFAGPFSVLSRAQHSRRATVSVPGRKWSRVGTHLRKSVIGAGRRSVQRARRCAGAAHVGRFRRIGELRQS